MKKQLFDKNFNNESLNLKLVKIDGTIIKSIPNPSERLQLAAVKQNPNSIKYISNPCLYTQLYVVEINGNLIDFILNPCKEVQMKAILRNPNSIEFIKNPDCEVQRLAVQNINERFEYFMTVAYQKINDSIALNLLYKKMPIQAFKQLIKSNPNYKTDAQLVLEAIK